MQTREKVVIVNALHRHGMYQNSLDRSAKAANLLNGPEFILVEVDFDTRGDKAATLQKVAAITAAAIAEHQPFKVYQCVDYNEGNSGAPESSTEELIACNKAAGITTPISFIFDGSDAKARQIDEKTYGEGPYHFIMKFVVGLKGGLQLVVPPSPDLTDFPSRSISAPALPKTSSGKKIPVKTKTHAHSAGDITSCSSAAAHSSSTAAKQPTQEQTSPTPTPSSCPPTSTLTRSTTAPTPAFFNTDEVTFTLCAPFPKGKTLSPILSRTNTPEPIEHPIHTAASATSTTTSPLLRPTALTLDKKTEATSSPQLGLRLLNRGNQGSSTPNTPGNSPSGLYTRRHLSTFLAPSTVAAEERKDILDEERKDVLDIDDIQLIIEKDEDKAAHKYKPLS
jgi:hypothetical protein